MKDNMIQIKRQVRIIEVSEFNCDKPVIKINKQEDFFHLIEYAEILYKMNNNYYATCPGCVYWYEGELNG